jgi:hypothetical protein
MVNGKWHHSFEPFGNHSFEPLGNGSFEPSYPLKLAFGYSLLSL